MIIEGATPKETISAKESSSFPMTEDTLSMRAANPSQKSKIADTIIHTDAASKFPFSAAMQDMHPETRFKHVNVFGMCFFIDV